MKVEFVEQYLKTCSELVNDKKIIEPAMRGADLLRLSASNGRKVIFAGNGASAAIASHAALDFTKQAKIRSNCFNEPAFLTAFANDYGYENWLKKALELHMDKDDVVVLISSSGTSPNIVNAAEYVRSCENELITFTGFDSDNPCNLLSTLGFWVDCRAYNIIEGVHQIWLLMICDMIIGKSEYSVK